MKTKWKIILAGLLAVAIIGYMVFENLKALEAPVLEVKPGNTATTFKEEGVVVPAVEQNVYALYPGEILEVAVEEGQTVAAGELLVSINTKEIDFQLQQLNAQLKSVEGEQSDTFQKPFPSQIASSKLMIEQAEKDLAVYEANLERFELLYEAGALAEKDFQDAQHAVARAENNLAVQKQALKLLEESSSSSGTAQFYAGRLESLQAQISFLEYQKQKQQVTAAIDGVVSNLAVKKGNLAIAGTQLLTIFQPASCELEVFVLTSDVHNIHQGTKVDLIMEKEKEDQVFPGIVKSIAPSAVSKISALGLEEQRVKVTISWEDANGIIVFPGYRIDAEFIKDQIADVLIVPKTAVFPYEEGEAVWLLSDGKAVTQSVKTGFETNRDVVITEGLEAGDQIIINPQLEGLKAGKRIVAAEYVLTEFREKFKGRFRV